MSSVYIRKIAFPYRKISKIKKSIRFAIEPHIPIPVENTKVFFHPISVKSNERGGSGLDVISFVIPDDVLNWQLSLINSAELACNEIELIPLSIFDFFVSSVQIRENVLWLYVGEESTYIFSVLKNGELADLRQIPAVRKDLEHEKGELKREISTMLLSKMSRFYEGEIEQIYVSGLPQICNWLSESFSIPVKSIEFKDLVFVEQDKHASETNLNFIPEMLYAGLAGNRNISINFHPPVLQEKEIKGIQVACFLAVFVLVVLTFRLQFERSVYERKLAALDSQIKNIFLQTFPEAVDARTPLLQMQSRVKELRNKTSQSDILSLSPLEALREISQGLDESLQVQLDSFRLKEEGVILSGSAASYGDIDKVKEILENSKIFSEVEIESAQTTDKGISFRLKVGWQN